MRQHGNAYTYERAQWRQKGSWTCESDSLAHSRDLNDIAPCQRHDLRRATGGSKRFLCYLFATQVCNTKEVLLSSLRSIREARVDILRHMDQSMLGISAPLVFLKNSSKALKKKNVLEIRSGQPTISWEVRKAKSRWFPSVQPSFFFNRESPRSMQAKRS